MVLVMKLGDSREAAVKIKIVLLFCFGGFCWFLYFGLFFISLDKVAHTVNARTHEFWVRLEYIEKKFLGALV